MSINKKWDRYGPEKIRDVRAPLVGPSGASRPSNTTAPTYVVDVETARYLTCQEVSKAKAWTSDAHRLVTALAHQCHGAIGFIKEMDVHLSHNRAKVSELLFDGSAFHLEG